MAGPLFADRVKETSTTTGTGTLNLAGAVAGFISFVAGIGNGNTVYYCIEDGTNWEVGIGTVTSGSPDTLSRTTILASSNGGAAVNFGAGTKNVFCTIPASTFGGSPIADGFLKRNAANNGWEQVAYGTSANTVCQGNDSRLSNLAAIKVLTFERFY